MAPPVFCVLKMEPASGAGGKGRRIGTASIRGSQRRLPDDGARREIGQELLGAEAMHIRARTGQRPGVGGKAFVEQEQPRAIAAVRRRSMQRARMMHGHAAGLARERHGLVEMKVGIVRIDGAAEHAVLVVVAEDRPLVRARDDLQRTVGKVHILQHQAAGEDVVVGVGIEGPVLMPLHRGASAGGLGVELGCLQQHVRAEQAASAPW